MSIPDQSTVQNQLLAAASSSDFALLQPHLTKLSMHLRQRLLVPHMPIDVLYFPDSGFVSITAEGRGRPVEVGLLGREGLIGAFPVLLGGESTPYCHFVQSPGELWSITAAALNAAVDQSASLKTLLLRSVHILMMQTMQTACANACYGIEARLARWLLMCQDRLGDELSITHEFLSMMLGVQRTSVTLAIQVLEGNHLIKARRGHVAILHRDGLRVVAGQSYGLAEAEQARMIGGHRVSNGIQAHHLEQV